jgi:hypothetical protein
MSLNILAEKLMTGISGEPEVMSEVTLPRKGELRAMGK